MKIKLSDNDKYVISRFINSSILDIKNSINIYKELEFIDDNKHGFMDLVVEYEDEFRINEHISYLERKNKHGLITTEQFEKKLIELQYKKQLAIEQKDSNAIEYVYTFPSTYNDRLFLDELFPLTKYEFADTYFYGPKDANVFLTRCYGDFMQLPSEEKRIPHYSNVYFL